MSQYVSSQTGVQTPSTQSCVSRNEVSPTSGSSSPPQPSGRTRSTKRSERGDGRMTIAKAAGGPTIAAVDGLSRTVLTRSHISETPRSRRFGRSGRGVQGADDRLYRRYRLSLPVLVHEA